MCIPPAMTTGYRLRSTLVARVAPSPRWGSCGPHIPAGMTLTTGAPSAWIPVWILLVLALGVTGGILIGRGLHARHGPVPSQVPPTEAAAVREAKDALWLRYANGEISREDCLQGKVELED